MKIWIVNSCCPDETSPVIPSPFATESEAEAYADKMMRSEWDSAAPEDGSDHPMKYPGDWREAQDILVDWCGDGWGTWEITEHELLGVDPLHVAAPEASNFAGVAKDLKFATTYDLMSDAPEDKEAVDEMISHIEVAIEEPFKADALAGLLRDAGAAIQSLQEQIREMRRIYGDKENEINEALIGFHEVADRIEAALKNV